MPKKSKKEIQESIKQTMEKIANMTKEEREEFDRNFNMGASEELPEDYDDEWEE